MNTDLYQEGKILGISDNLRVFQHGLGTRDWTVFVDIALVAFILYSVYILIRETRALRILYGILTLAAVYLLAQVLNLVALNFILQSVFAVTLVAIPVVFQPELRAALERLGRGKFISSILANPKQEAKHITDQLFEAIEALSAKQIGALMVIERQTGLKDLSDRGVRINADLSPQLLFSIFLKKSPLHDGAVIIKDARIVAASVFLPIAEDFKDLSLGTRHRAGVGITKDTDAVVVIVSEETGKVSIAHHERLDAIALDDFKTKLNKLLKPKEI